VKNGARVASDGGVCDGRFLVSGQNASFDEEGWSVQCEQEEKLQIATPTLDNQLMLWFEEKAKVDGL